MLWVGLKPKHWYEGMEGKKIQVEGELDNVGVGLSRGLWCMNTLVHKQGKVRPHVVGLALIPYNIMTDSYLEWINLCFYFK